MLRLFLPKTKVLNPGSKMKMAQYPISSQFSSPWNLRMKTAPFHTWELRTKTAPYHTWDHRMKMAPFRTWDRRTKTALFHTWELRTKTAPSHTWNLRMKTVLCNICYRSFNPWNPRMKTVPYPIWRARKCPSTTLCRKFLKSSWKLQQKSRTVPD